MPSTYSHYYFGHLVYQRLSNQKRVLIHNHRLFFDVGQNGADVLLYHSAFKPSFISKQNQEIHHMTGIDFFTQIQKNAFLSKKHQVYIYGYICHFVLDAYLHPYVEMYKDNHQVSHMLIEREFERYLLEKNQLNPLKYNLTNHIHITHQLCDVMSDFVKGATQKDMKRTLQKMKIMYCLTKASSHLKRKLIYLWMDYHQKSYLKDFVFTKELDSRCVQSNIELEKLLLEAVDIAVDCIDRFDSNDLSHEIYNRIFG